MRRKNESEIKPLVEIREYSWWAGVCICVFMHPFPATAFQGTELKWDWDGWEGQRWDGCGSRRFGRSSISHPHLHCSAQSQLLLLGLTNSDKSSQRPTCLSGKCSGAQAGLCSWSFPCPVWVLVLFFSGAAEGFACSSPHLGRNPALILSYFIPV